jgi:hypothetical protein
MNIAKKSMASLNILYYNSGQVYWAAHCCQWYQKQWNLERMWRYWSFWFGVLAWSTVKDDQYCSKWQEVYFLLDLPFFYTFCIKRLGVNGLLDCILIIFPQEPTSQWQWLIIWFNLPMNKVVKARNWPFYTTLVATLRRESTE